MAKILRTFPIFIIIVLFIIAFSSSYASLNMDNLAYTLAIGIDTSNQNKLEVTFQFSTLSSSSESGTSGKSEPILNSVHASSLNNAINLMNNYMGKKINLSHCKVIVFSENIAKQGISNEIYTLSNNPQLRPSANILISKCTARYYLEQTKPELENSMASYYEILTNSSEYTGFIPNSTIGTFFYSMLCKDCEAYAILGNVNDSHTENNNVINSQKDYLMNISESSISGKNSAECIGIAVFKDDKIVGELNALESICFLAIDDSIDRFLISVPDPNNNQNYLDIYLGTYGMPKIKVDTSTNSPYIKIEMDLIGRIYSMSENSDYLNSETMDEISRSCNSYLESSFSNYLYKTSKEFHSDINGFGKKALSNFKNTKDVDDYNWLKNYQNAFFDVKINTSIKSGMLITET
ncbi:MAG: Ger(x)C family spore germination C-terminal domain-containing protein [Clostridia bacterium]|nr:Ger(x)C family spore germination C-terminal domain-containing protein [Clostridia bacterium]